MVCNKLHILQIFLSFSELSPLLCRNIFAQCNTTCFASVSCASGEGNLKIIAQINIKNFPTSFSASHFAIVEFALWLKHLNLFLHMAWEWEDRFSTCDYSILQVPFIEETVFSHPCFSHLCQKSISFRCQALFLFLFFSSTGHFMPT